MSDIGVSTTIQTLNHKLNDGLSEDGMECYWTFSVLPLKVKTGDRLWMAIQGQWRGYFVIKARDSKTQHLVFASESWVKYSGGPRKPFQGFTYKVPEVSS